MFKHKEEVNNLPKIQYKIGFRIYPDKVENWKSLQKYWPHNRIVSTDQNGKMYIGDGETFDEIIPSYSKRIKMYAKLIFIIVN